LLEALKHREANGHVSQGRKAFVGPALERSAGMQVLPGASFARAAIALTFGQQALFGKK
jgi:hypothetical protein